MSHNENPNDSDTIRAANEHVERAEACYPIAGHPNATPAITVTLTAYNMGAECDEQDFAAWHTFVCERIDEAVGFVVDDVDMHDYRNGPSEDTVTGGTDEQRAAIRSWLAHEGWDLFCATTEARP